MDADVIQRAAVLAGLEIPRGPRARQQRMLALDAHGADLAERAAADNFAQGAKGGGVAAVELQADEQAALRGEALDGGLLGERGAERLVAQHMAARV